MSHTDCRINPFHSGVCSLGTKGCDVSHGIVVRGEIDMSEKEKTKPCPRCLGENDPHLGSRCPTCNGLGIITDDMSEKKKLLDCPICKGKVETFYNDNEDYESSFHWSVDCDNCGLEFSGRDCNFQTKEEAVKAWNTRAPYSPKSKIHRCPFCSGNGCVTDLAICSLCKGSGSVTIKPYSPK